MTYNLHTIDLNNVQRLKERKGERNKYNRNIVIDREVDPQYLNK